MHFSLSAISLNPGAPGRSRQARPDVSIPLFPSDCNFSRTPE